MKTVVCLLATALANVATNRTAVEETTQRCSCVSRLSTQCEGESLLLVNTRTPGETYKLGK